MTTSRLIAGTRGRARPCPRGASPDPVPRRMLAVGLGLGLLAAAVSLSGCTADVGGGGLRNGTPGTAADVGAPRDGTAGTSVGPTLPEQASLVATAAIPDVVPAGLAGRTWVVRSQSGRAVAGSLRSARRLRLPPDERPLAASAGRVASAAPSASGSGSVVVVRSLQDGTEVVRAQRPEEVLAAVFVGDVVILGGHVPGTPGRDPGVVAISLSDGSVSVLIAPTDVPAAAAVGLFRTVAVSPSGRALVSGLCGPEDCAIDVVDLATGATHRIVESAGGFPGVVTDGTVVVGSADSDWIAGLDLATGERRWRRDGAEFQHAYAIAGDRIVQALVERSGTPTFRLEIVDALAGTGSLVLSRDAVDGLTLWPELSDESLAVLGSGRTFADAAGAGPNVRAGAVDLVTGAFEGDGLRVDLGPDGQ